METTMIYGEHEKLQLICKIKKKKITQVIPHINGEMVKRNMNISEESWKCKELQGAASLMMC